MAKLMTRLTRPRTRLVKARARSLTIIQLEVVIKNVFPNGTATTDKWPLFPEQGHIIIASVTDTLVSRVLYQAELKSQSLDLINFMQTF